MYLLIGFVLYTGRTPVEPTAQCRHSYGLQSASQDGQSTVATHARPALTVTLSDAFVGFGSHAKLSVQGCGQWFVEDLKSLNGVMVNGSLIKCATALTIGDIVTFGHAQSELVYVFEQCENTSENSVKQWVAEPSVDQQDTEPVKRRKTGNRLHSVPKSSHFWFCRSYKQRCRANSRSGVSQRVDNAVSYCCAVIRQIVQQLYRDISKPVVLSPPTEHPRRIPAHLLRSARLETDVERPNDSQCVLD